GEAIRYCFNDMDASGCAMTASLNNFHFFLLIFSKGFSSSSIIIFNWGLSYTSWASSVLYMSNLFWVEIPGLVLKMVVRMGKRGTLSGGVFDKFEFTGIVSASNAFIIPFPKLDL